jgi:hypothetical protein
MHRQAINFISSHTTKPNTPESDLLEFVEHEVILHYHNGDKDTHILQARCPLHATELVKKSLTKPDCE